MHALRCDGRRRRRRAGGRATNARASQEAAPDGQRRRRDGASNPARRARARDLASKDDDGRPARSAHAGGAASAPGRGGASRCRGEGRRRTSGLRQGRLQPRAAHRNGRAPSDAAASLIFDGVAARRSCEDGGTADSAIWTRRARAHQGRALGAPPPTRGTRRRDNRPAAKWPRPCRCSDHGLERHRAGTCRSSYEGASRAGPAHDAPLGRHYGRQDGQYETYLARRSPDGSSRTPARQGSRRDVSSVVASVGRAHGRRGLPRAGRAWTRLTPGVPADLGYVLARDTGRARLEERLRGGGASAQKPRPTPVMRQDACRGWPALALSSGSSHHTFSGRSGDDDAAEGGRQVRSKASAVAKGDSLRPRTRARARARAKTPTTWPRRPRATPNGAKRPLNAGAARASAAATRSRERGGLGSRRAGARGGRAPGGASGGGAQSSGAGEQCAPRRPSVAAQAEAALGARPVGREVHAQASAVRIYSATPRLSVGRPYRPTGTVDFMTLYLFLERAGNPLDFAMMGRGFRGLPA